MKIVFLLLIFTLLWALLGGSWWWMLGAFVSLAVLFVIEEILDARY
jgi:hypothetical protein